MPRRTQTYAIRLAVEGGGQVKAELVTVGQRGEQSLKRIETAGDKASGGLKGPEMDAGVRDVGRRKRRPGGRWSAGCRPLAIEASWPPCRRHLGDVG